MALMPKDGVLSGLLVAEIGCRIAVAACGGLLAQLGADVVLVEPAQPGANHKWRDRATTAAGKRSLVIDHQSPIDRALYRKLVDTADVLLVSSDVADDQDDLWESGRPSTQIRCDITGFGRHGPHAGRPGSEALIEALAGIAETTGHRGGPPVLLGAPLLEMESAVYAAASTIAALRVRRQHGFGQRIDIALYDVGVNALAAFLPLPFSGRVATRNGNRHPTLSPWNAYLAADGWVLICAPTDDQWARLCAVMGQDGYVGDPRFATTTSRMEHADAIDEIVGAWVATMSVASCVDTLNRMVIPSGPVVPVAELAAEPNLRHRGMVQAVVDPETGRRVLLPGCPIRWRDAISGGAIPPRDADRAALARELSDRPSADDLVTGDPVSHVRPLDGVRVVEIGMNTVGPLAGKQLGALGADVLKIEPPRGDANRHNAPLRADGLSYVFALLNTDKRGLVLDLRDPADREVLWDVLRTADVLIENLKPGSLARLGFGPDEVRAALPHLIYCSINGFGHRTVYPQRPALDTVVQAMSGAMSSTTVDGVPTKAGISVSDQLGGLFGLLGVLAALESVASHGRGVTLDLAMQDGSAWATHRIWNTIEPANARVERDTSGWVLAEEGTTTAISTVDEVLTDPHTSARNLLVERPTAEGDGWTVLGSPMRLLSTPAEVRSVMPRLGVLDPAIAEEFDLVVAESGRVRRTGAAATGTEV
jgi:crotonobetainyl-CoA:carnitine CoA-transferase CaiB-like acyl-CoA transferase